MPIIVDDETILTFKNAKLIPTAKASILVAITNVVNSLFDNSSLLIPSSSKVVLASLTASFFPSFASFLFS